MKFYYIIVAILAIFALIKYFRNRKRKPYETKIALLKEQIKNNSSITTKGGHIFGLKKMNTAKIELSNFNTILSVDFDNKTITVEGSIQIGDILKFLISRKHCLYVMPDMHHLTIGGLISGVGGGSSTFKHGYIHDNIESFTLLKSDGTLVNCSRFENKDLFYALPNSLGTLGYIVKVVLRIKPCDPYVVTKNIKFDNENTFFKTMFEYTKDESIDFLDGVIYADNLFVLIVGRFQKTIDKEVNNFYKDIYWDSLLKDDNHYFHLYDYVFRWDHDMYFSSMNTPSWSRNKQLRGLVPKFLRKSTFVKKAAPFLNLTVKECPLMNDIFIPYKKASKFFKWYKDTINTYPIYICPAKAKDESLLYPQGLYFDFGISYGVYMKNNKDKDYVKKLEEVMYKYKGHKLLYNKFYLDENKFWKIYQNKDKYQELKQKYDPTNKFLNIYEKIK